MADQEWRPVVGYEGIYEVSDQGSVRSINRVMVTRTGQRRRYQGMTLSLDTSNTGGYPAVVLSKGGKYANRTVHSLMAEAFIGPRPKGQEVLHDNDDPTDNRIENLTYGTRGKNIEDQVRNGNHFQARKTHCKNGHSLTDVSNLDARLLAELGQRHCMACRRDKNRRNKKNG